MNRQRTRFQTGNEDFLKLSQIKNLDINSKTKIWHIAIDLPHDIRGRREYKEGTPGTGHIRCTHIGTSVEPRPLSELLSEG